MTSQEELTAGAGGAGAQASGGDAAGGDAGGSTPEGGSGATSSGGAATGGISSGGISSGGNNGGTAGEVALGGSGGSSGSGGSAGQPSCPAEQVGFSTVMGKVTGGAEGAVVKASTATQLKTFAMQVEPLTIQIDSKITLAEQIRPKSDKTILGVGKNAELTGGGLYILDVHNVIVQNLKISKALGEDAISVQNSQRVWIDHCDLSSDLASPKATYDDLVAVTHASDYVTVSWTHFHDHDAVSLVGHSKEAAAIAEDTGHLTVTYHHNWFSDTKANNPRVRFGKVHIFNNLFERVAANAVISQMGAQVYVENNSFQNVLIPITTQYEDPDDGAVTETGNSFSADSGPNQITLTSTWLPPYGYDAESPATVEFLVPTCAGVGKL